MKPENIKKLLTKAIVGPSKWELDTIIWADRSTNPTVLVDFLNHIDYLQSLEKRSLAQESELSNLLELLAEMDEEDCEALLTQPEEDIKEAYIEDLARTSAIEVLTNGKVSFETMNISCRLSPNDFILCAKRTQDLINAIHGLVIKGETLSKDVAGA